LYKLLIYLGPVSKWVEEGGTLAGAYLGRELNNASYPSRLGAEYSD